MYLRDKTTTHDRLTAYIIRAENNLREQKINGDLKLTYVKPPLVVVIMSGLSAKI